ncbi:MAG: 50S ribosomal protein L21 [SAR202 cluster bacterium]|nr:50S ribosomal protein L21 [SAR202 cluster bacterium]
MATYAIVHTGGKQYLVHEGDVIRVESLPHEEGESLELTDVRLVSRDGDVTVGEPSVSGAKVTATVTKNGKAGKLIVFKYKSKTRNRKKNGHRQPFSELRITGIKA